MSIAELGRSQFREVMGVRLSEEQLGEMGKRIFQQVMGVGPKMTLSERAADITHDFEKWEAEGINVKQISKLQRKILAFSEKVFALHYELNREKLALEDKRKREGSSRETFDMFRTQSRKYVVIRDWNDKAKGFIDEMEDKLTMTAEHAISHLTPETIRNEGQVEWVRKTLALFSVFNDRQMRSLSRQLDEMLERASGDECSNYLLFCHNDLDARWQEVLSSHREVDGRLSALLDQRVEELTT